MKPDDQMRLMGEALEALRKLRQSMPPLPYPLFEQLIEAMAMLVLLNNDMRKHFDNDKH